MAIDPGVPILEEADLEERIADEEPVLVFFYADWCGFCRAFAPAFREKVERIDVDAVAANISSESDPRWKSYEVKAVPTLVGFRDGREVARADARPGRGLKAEDVDRVVAELEA